MKMQMYFLEYQKNRCFLDEFFFFFFPVNRLTGELRLEGLDEELLEGGRYPEEKGSRGVNLTGHKCNKCKASKLDQCIVRDRNKAMVSGDVRSNKRDMTPRLLGWLITRWNNKKDNWLIIWFWLNKCYITSGTWRRKVSVMLSKVWADVSQSVVWYKFWPLTGLFNFDCCLTATNWFIITFSFLTLLDGFFLFLFFFLEFGGNEEVEASACSPGSVTKDEVGWSSDEDSTPNKRKWVWERTSFGHGSLNFWRFKVNHHLILSLFLLTLII